MNGEGTLNTNAEGNLADGEGLANACTLAANDEALEDLDTVVLTFNDLNVNVQGVTGAECGDGRHGGTSCRGSQESA